MVEKHVKVSRDGERFWVKVLKETKTGYIGTVDNHTVTDRFPYGSEIIVHKNDVLDIC